MGLRATLFLAIGGTPIVSALRVASSETTAVLATAFASGICTAAWAVSNSPVIAQFTNERNRPWAFSLTFAAGIGTGALAGIAGGRLPSVAGSVRGAILAGSLIALAALILAFRLPVGSVTKDDAKNTGATPFVRRFLFCAGVWSLATGMFNPFFNVYFSRIANLTVERIGALFSVSQVFQAAAILVAPLVIRRLTLVPSIAVSQSAAAAALAALGILGGWPALYVAYVSFQYMTEPGMYSLLMNEAGPGGRARASALNFLVVFSMQAAAAAAAGSLITRAGYSITLFAAAIVALIAALCSYLLLRPAARGRGGDAPV
jgi:hypothetical protein